MSIITNQFFSTNISSLESITNQQSKQIQNLNNLYSKNERQYDQVTKQSVNISYDETSQRYRFEIQKPENDIYIYQIWKNNNTQLNNNRNYYYVKLSDWINLFRINNEKCEFTPSTLIEINTIYYPTVMVDACIESKNGLDYCVLYFENKTINTLHGIILNEIPKTGQIPNVRFDIDELTGLDILAGNYQPISSINISNFLGLWISSNRSDTMRIQTDSVIFSIPNINLPIFRKAFIKSGTEIIIKSEIDNNGIFYVCDIILGNKYTVNAGLINLEVIPLSITILYVEGLPKQIYNGTLTK
jgi:hypothetical protein